MVEQSERRNGHEKRTCTHRMWFLNCSDHPDECKLIHHIKKQIDQLKSNPELVRGDSKYNLEAWLAMIALEEEFIESGDKKCLYPDEARALLEEHRKNVIEYSERFSKQEK